MGDDRTLGMLLPWHQENWQLLQSGISSNRLPHAILLTGAAGLGKHLFARRLAASLLCKERSADGRPCGVCQNCRLFRVGNHPDFRQIMPEEEGKAIKIDIIREFTAKEALTAQAGGYKVVIIEPADALNIAAANSLLKTLEEPVEWTVMILLTAKPSHLPATIRSRCQCYHFAPPDRAQAVEWLSDQITDTDPELMLALTSNSPLKALDLANPEMLKERLKMLDEFIGIQQQTCDPVMVASRWKSLDLQPVLNWLSSWVIDMIRLKASPGTTVIINLDQKESLQALGSRLNFIQLYRLLDQIYEAIRSSGSQLNTHMLLENLLLTWAGNVEGEQ